MKIKPIIIAAIITLFGLYSCTGNFLEEKNNPNELSPGVFWKSEGDVLKGLTSVYGSLQPSASWGIAYERYIVIDNYRSDECDFRPDVSSWSALATFTNDANNDVSKKEWTYLFKGINYANQCIDNIPNVPNLDEGFMKEAVSEARFLRAYYYYRLYTNFGENLPLYTKQIVGTEEEFYPIQQESGVIVQFIESELMDIIEQDALPEKRESNGKGRITKYTPIALLGKFYMFRNQLPKAEKEFEKLIGKFQLTENFEENFDGLHKNNSESIFEVQFSGDKEGGQYEYNLLTLHLASMNAPDGGGYEEAYPSAWLVETMKEDKTVEGEYSERVYATILFNDPKSIAFYYEDGKSFLDYHSEDEVFWKKFVTWDPSLGPEWYYSGFNIPLIRYADILLLYAECLNDKGNTPEAIGYINQVRNRSNLPLLDTSMSKDETLMHLQNIERPCEFALEGIRWYDLIRWGKVKSTLEANKKPFVENFIESKHELLPIPHKELLLNPEWKQNPLFSK